MINIIFACVHNAGRSQMAAAFFNELANNKKAKAISAGTEPASQLHQNVIDCMNEIGIDLSKQKPQKLNSELAKDSHYLITLGCNESCPYLENVKRLDWKFEDPKGKSVEETRKIRDEIKSRIEIFINELDVNKAK